MYTLWPLRDSHKIVDIWNEIVKNMNIELHDFANMFFAIYNATDNRLYVLLLAIINIKESYFYNL